MIKKLFLLFFIQVLLLNSCLALSLFNNTPQAVRRNQASLRVQVKSYKFLKI